MLTRAEYDLFAPGDQGGTYTAQPLAMAAALAVLEYLQQEDVLANVRAQETLIRKILGQLAPQFGLTDIRGRGLLLAFDLPEPRAAQVAAACLEQGLIINAPQPATIRLMPALTVTAAEVEAMFTILRRVLAVE